MERIALVTGGSRGIGAATARLLAARGWNLCISYRSDADAARQVIEQCREAGRKALAARADVSRESDIRDLFSLIDEQLGTLTALVNNAGIVAPLARVDEMSAERLQQVLSVNVVGQFLCAREAIRRMSTRHGGEGGVIVNVSSRHHRHRDPRQRRPPGSRTTCGRANPTPAGGAADRGRGRDSVAML